MTIDTTRPRSGTAAALQIVVLLALCVLAFLPEVGVLVRVGFRNTEFAHLLLAPLFIGLMVAFRRDALRAALGPGSIWGLVIVLAAIALFGVSTWPFNFGYTRLAAFVGAVAGVVLLVGGWRFFAACLPMLFILALCVPFGMRQYAALILLPERYTIEAVFAVVSRLPGISAELAMPDITWQREGDEGARAIALGETMRGATLLLTTAILGAFLTLMKPRPWWQVATMVVLTGPIVLATNFVRFLALALVTVVTDAGPESAFPRNVSVVVSIFAAYLMFTACLGVIGQLVTEVPADDDEGAAP